MISPIKIWREHKKLSDCVGKKGIIISWTFIHTAPEGFEYQLPYPIVLVRYKDGEKILTQMVDYNKNHLKSGQKVIAVLRKLCKTLPDEVIRYGIKVRPV